MGDVVGLPLVEVAISDEFAQHRSQDPATGAGAEPVQLGNAGTV